MIPKHIHTFVPFWHGRKKSLMVEIGLLNLQPFMNNHLPFLVTWFSKISSPLMLDSHPLLVCLADQCACHHGCPFNYFQSLCTILSKFCAITMPSPYTSTNWWRCLMRKACFASRNQIIVQTSSHDQVSSVIPCFHHLTTWIAPHWLTHVPSVMCYPYYKC